MAFWSSVDLTGNQTGMRFVITNSGFWSSVDLTGNQTDIDRLARRFRFWSSVDLTGNQTQFPPTIEASGFGAVSI